MGLSIFFIAAVALHLGVRRLTLQETVVSFKEQLTIVICVNVIKWGYELRNIADEIRKALCLVVYVIESVALVVLR